MTDQDPPELLETLSEATCHRHLDAASVGRVALVRAGRVEMFPVNYAMNSGAVIVRTHPGGALHALERGAAVVFEIDELDHRYQTGWSVVVHGTAEHVTDVAEIEQLEALELAPWAGGTRPDWIRIDLDEVSGRRIRWS